jgi:hypothetical protein
MINKFSSTIDISKITTNGYWGNNAEFYITEIVKNGLYKNRYFVPLIMVSIGEQQVSLDNISNIINLITSKYNSSELQVGVSSLTDFNGMHRDMELFKTYEKLFGSFPHEKVHGTYRYYMGLIKSPNTKLSEVPHKTVRKWVEQYYACFRPTVGTYLVPTSLLQISGEMFSCACFFPPKHLYLGNIWEDGLRKCLENANSNQFIRSITENNGFSEIIKMVPDDLLEKTCCHFCEACEILGSYLCP